MAVFAEYPDVEAIWRPLTPAEQAVATNLLAYASRIIRQQVPDVDDRIAAGKLDADLVRDVAAEAVRRRMQNPEGKRSESVDDYSYTRDQAQAAGTVYITDDELRLLRVRRGRAFSIRPMTPAATSADVEQVALQGAQRDADLEWAAARRANRP